MSRVLLALGALVALGACAAAPPRSEPPVARIDDHRESREQMARLEEAESALRARLEAPDCDGACGAVERICELSGSICEIAHRHEDDPELVDRCGDAHRRCARARVRIDESPCECAPPDGASR